MNRTLTAAIFAALYAGAGYAQQAPESKTTSMDEITVTGTLIRGTPVDTALPVAVFTSEELEQRGSPSALDFVKSLSSSGPTTGEAYYFGGSGNSSNVGFNLRGIGADKTLTLFNGKRAFENASVYPNSVIERVDVLKDGAAVTYGADATGGVVNLITKDNFRGFEAGGSYKYYNGSDQGEWKLHGVAGFGSDHASVLFAVEWDHRSELHSYKRDFAKQPYAVNPAPYSTLTSLAGWLPRGALPATPQVLQPVPPATQNGAGEWGNPTGGVLSDFTQSSCEAVGGIYVNNFTCSYGYASFYNLVEQNDIYRVFGQVKADITDDTEFYLRALYTRNYLPHQYGSPSQPVVRGPARLDGLSYQIYVPSVNPYTAAFAQRTGFANAGGAFTATRGYTPITYRAFSHGGNDTFASGDNHSTPNEDDTHYWHISMGFDGKWADAVNYDIGVTYNQFVYTSSQADILGFRLQEALNGYGGPNCNTAGVDQDPNRYGTQATAPGVPDTGVRPAGCMWWNPFASNFAGQPILGLTNPNYIASATNPQSLREWVFDQREQQTNNYKAVVDAVFSGETPLHLFSDQGIAWGAGAQWSIEKNRESVDSPFYNNSQLCDWPGQQPDPNGTSPNWNGCSPPGPGPFMFFGTNEPDSTQQRRYSYFAQVDLPVYKRDANWASSLDITGAGRHEEFSGDLKSTVWKVSGKFQLMDFDGARIALRGALGTNYQAPGPDVIPGEVVNGVNSYTIAANNWRGATTVTRSDIVPETARVWSTGIVGDFKWASTQTLQVLFDYFHIQTINELGLLASANDIANAIFNGRLQTNGFRQANCSHPLISRVTFNGSCVQGTATVDGTTANDFSAIRTDFGNGPSQLTSGYDLNINYSVGVGPGTLRLGLEMTKLKEFMFSPIVLDGVTIKGADNRLGTLNFATIANAAPEWRGAFDVNYGIGDHNIRMRINYTSGVDDERFVDSNGNVINAAGLIPGGFQRGTTTTFAPSYYGVYGEDWVSGDVYYMWNISDKLTFNASVVNFTDQDPPASRQELGYDPRIGSPLGRTLEVGLKAKF